MSVDPALKCEPRALGSRVDGHIEVLLERHLWAEQDRVVILVWSGEAPLGDVLAGQRFTRSGRRRLRPGAEDGARPISAEVRYAGQVLARFDLAESGEVAWFVLTHAGGHLNPDGFSLHQDGAASELGELPVVRAAVLLATRPETETERLARRLFLEPTGESEPYPSSAELLVLRRALLQGLSAR